MNDFVRAATRVAKAKKGRQITFSSSDVATEMAKTHGVRVSARTCRWGVGDKKAVLRKLRKAAKARQYRATMNAVFTHGCYTYRMA